MNLLLADVTADRGKSLWVIVTQSIGNVTVYFRFVHSLVYVAGIFAPAETVVGLFEGRGLPLGNLVTQAGIAPAMVWNPSYKEPASCLPSNCKPS